MFTFTDGLVKILLCIMSCIFLVYTFEYLNKPRSNEGRKIALTRGLFTIFGSTGLFALMMWYFTR